MADDRVPPGIPSIQPPDDGSPRQHPSGGGFLVEGTSEPVDGEQLFRETVRWTPALKPTQHKFTSEDPEPMDTTRLGRIGGWTAIGVGVLVFLLAQNLVLSLFLLGIGAVLVFYISSPARLKREHVVDRWDYLIDGGQGRADEIITAMTAHIDRQRLPTVDYVRLQLAASRIRSEKRPFLVVSQRAAGRLRPYRVYVNVRDYGTNLQTSWFLIYQRGFFERLKPNPLVELNLFDEQDLRAYVTAVHHAVLDGVVELMLSLGQDASKLDRKTNGFLGIS